MMSISEVVTKLIQFNKTERTVNVVLHMRDENGDVVGRKTFPVEVVFSHQDDRAEIFITEKV